MNRSNFLDNAKTKIVYINQEGTEGFSMHLKFENMEGEESIEYMDYKGEKRLFKSLNGCYTALQNAKVFNFVVKITADTVSLKKRAVLTPEQKKAKKEALLKEKAEKLKAAQKHLDDEMKALGLKK